LNGTHLVGGLQKKDILEKKKTKNQEKSVPGGGQKQKNQVFKGKIRKKGGENV